MDVPLRRPSPHRDNLTGEKRESIRNSGESVRTCDEEEKQVAADSLVSTEPSEQTICQWVDADL